MVADSVMYHPVVSHYLKFVASTIGRDKAMRLIQYFSRFMAWYLYRTNQPASAIAPYESMKKQFAFTRKVMRVGKFVEHFRAASQAADNKSMDPVLKYCTVGRQLGLGTFMFFDNLTAIDTIGVRKLAAAARMQKDAYRAWVTALTFSIMGGLYSLYQLRQRAMAIDKKDAEGAVESKKIQQEQSAAKLQLISDLCDMTVPTTALGLSSLDDGLVGLAGTVSSLIALVGVWKKTA